MVAFGDIFQIVFSEAWWIGRKEDNPEEARLDFPKELFEVELVQHLSIRKLFRKVEEDT
uniref:DNA-binding protein RHL1 isoform X3 n=1 Tax=Rhizophora mucronata TaxID=61149 RepID=A0A2P2LD88_RHIMU